VPRLLALAQGGTAVGTGLNAKKGFAEAFAQAIADDTGAACGITLCLALPPHSSPQRPVRQSS
jgi:aspartate ammonia-lyase